KFSAIQFAATAIESVRQFNRIERVNPIEQLNCAARFVRLEMADQVPTSSIATNFGNLRVGFLHAVLAEINLTSRNRFAHLVGRMRLTYRDQRDVVSRAMCTSRSLHDGSPYFLDPHS